MADHNELGKQGEEFALEYLTGKGYKIRATNWRYGKMEVDIIAEYAKSLAVVEVKTRSVNSSLGPADVLTRDKQRFLINAANAYVQKNNIDLETRFDLIFVSNKNGKLQAEHIEDAFSPSW